MRRTKTIYLDLGNKRQECIVDENPRDWEPSWTDRLFGQPGAEA